MALACTVATGFWFWYYKTTLACPGQSWSCEKLLLVAIASLGYGVSLGAAYTSLAVLLGLLVHVLKPTASTLEPSNKAVPVAATLFALQAGLTGAIALAGALPERWPWWLGAFGALLT